MYGDAVACLLIGLGIGLDGEDAVDLPFLKALEPQAFTRHEAADASAVFHDALDAACLQRVGDIAPDASAAGIAACKSQVHGITWEGLFVAFLCSFLDKQNARAFSPMIGERGLPIPGGETASGVRLLWVSAAKVYKRLLGRDQIQAGFSAYAACTGSLGAGYSAWVVDAGALRSSEDLYKSFSTCAEDR